MSPKEQNLALAQLLGLGIYAVPRYSDDLNLVHGAINALFPNTTSLGYYHPLWYEYERNLKIATGGSPTTWNDHDYQMASASQKTEAILKTFGLWKSE